MGRGARQRRPWIDIAPELGEWIDAQQSIEPTGGSRFCRSAFLMFRCTLFWERSILIIEKVRARRIKIIEEVEAGGVVRTGNGPVTP
jgi:hypothetical protein